MTTTHMMRIDRLEATAQGKLVLHFKDGGSERVTAAIITEFGLFSGLELDDEAYEELMAAISLSRSRNRAANMLSRRSMSRKELIKKLVEKGESREDSEAAADAMEEYGAIDDRQYAIDIVRRCSAKGYGPARIKNEFYVRGIDREYWDEALATQKDMSDEIDRFIEKRVSDFKDKKQINSVTNALRRRGYSWDSIKSALRRVGQGYDDYDE